jgi:hypothetical protein
MAMDRLTSHELECPQMCGGVRDLRVVKTWSLADVERAEAEVAEVSSLVLWTRANMRRCRCQWNHNVEVKLVDALELVL